MKSNYNKAAPQNVKTTSVTKIFDEPYSQHFLQEDSCNSQQFLEDCAYNVSLSNLYKFHDTCSYSKSMKYATIQVELLSSIKTYFDQKTYLLQVWDNAGVKVYEHRLDYKVKVWAICFQYLVYKTEQGDENSDCFTIVDLENNKYRDQGMIFVEDFVKDFSFTHVAFNNDVLYIGNSSEVHCVSAKVSSLGKGEKRRQIVHPDRDVRTISMDGNVLHSIDITQQNRKNGTVQLMIEISKDHIVIPVELQIQYLPTEDNKDQYGKPFNYSLVDQREYVPREANNDWIIQYKRIYTYTQTGENEIGFGVSLRQSGKIDIYYDMKFRETPEPIFKEVFITYDSIFLLKDDSSKAEEIDLEKMNRAIYRNRTEVKDFKYNYVTFQLIKNHCKIISGYILIETTMFVSHGHLISFLEIQTQNFKMVKHLDFECDVQTVFRKFNHNYEHNDIGVILQNSQIVTVSSKTPKNFATWTKDIHRITTLPGGNFLRMARDWKNFKFPMFLSTDNNHSKTYLSSAYDEYILDITDLLGTQLSTSDIVVGLYEEKDINTNFVLYQKENLYVYTIEFDNTTSKTHITQIHHMRLKRDQQDVDMYGGFINDDFLTMISSKNIYKFDLHLTEKNDENVDQVLTNVNWRGLLLTPDMKFIFTLNNRSVSRGTTSGLKFYEFKNIQQIEKSKQFVDRSYHLKNTQVGIQAFIDYSKTSDRITYFSDYENIKVIPNIKNNTLNLMGQDEYDKYIATRVIKDKFYALTKENVLSTWSILTGKKASPDYNVQLGEGEEGLMSQPFTQENSMDQSYHDGIVVANTVGKRGFVQQELNNAYFESKDYSDYRTFTCDLVPDIQKEGLYKHTLLIGQTDIIGYQESDFYEEQTIKQLMKKHKPWIQAQKKTYRRFKLIEIMGPQQIHEHLDFVFPYYFGAEQKIYFSDDLEYMLEQKFNKIVILYKRDQNDKMETVWNLHHRFSDFPQRIGLSKYMDVLSPDFQYFVDIDLSYGGYKIKKTSDEAIVHEIPLYLMSFQGYVTMEDGSKLKKEPRWVFNRFKWVSSKSFRLISDDGIESLIDFSSGKFKQTAYRNLQNFDVTTSQTQHAFYSRSALSRLDTLNRLSYKCRQYRSYSLFEKQNCPGMHPYEALFTIDYFASNKEKRFFADLSFTYLTWRLIEKIRDKELGVDEIDDSIVKMLSFNILPRGDQYLHYLEDNIVQLEKFYQRAMKENYEDYPITDALKYRIPMFENFKGLSIFDLSAKKKNFIAINMHLKYLQYYQIDHHSRMLAKIMPQVIENSLPNIIPYYKSRSQQTLNIKHYEKGTIPEMATNGVLACELIEDPDRIKLLVEDTKTNKPIELKYIDLPLIHCFKSDICQDYYAALGNTEQLEVFQLTEIQKQIDFVWDISRKYIIWKTFIPYVIFLYLASLYNFQYSNFYVTEESPEIDREIAGYVKIGLLVFSAYFLLREIRGGMVANFCEYIQDVWNIIDLAAPILIVIDVVYLEKYGEVGEADTENFHITQSIILFTMWFKILYYIRIFPSLGFYVKAIFTILFEIKYFLFVLLITYTAFGEAYRRISHVNYEENKFLLVDNILGGIMHEYLQSLGDFDMHAFGEIGVPYCRVLFVIATIINMIIMLNLLIAIVSVEFGKIDEAKSAAGLREKASLIADNIQLIPYSVIRNYCEKDQYLLYIQYITKHGKDKSLE